MKNYNNSILILLSISLIACSKKDKGAEKLLISARKSYAQKEYSQAKQEIDSIKILYPKDFKEIKASLTLLDSVRRGENMEIIEICDSIISASLPILEKQKKLFILQKDQKYQESGNYIPKESTSEYITGTTLRSGVEENGKLYIESVLVNGGNKHRKLKITAKDGSSIESLPVKDDGVNYRFTNMGKTYEIIRFMGGNENDIAKFIYSNLNKALTASIEGQEKYTLSLSQTIKSAIAKSYQLSIIMQQIDSIKTAKEKAEFHIYYLNNREKGKSENEILLNEKKR